MDIENSSRPSRGKLSLIFNTFALSFISLILLSVPVYATQANTLVPNPTGLSKMIMGLNAGPGTPQDFSIAKGVQYYRISIVFNNATILDVNKEARTSGVDYLGVLAGSTLGVERGGAAYRQHCIAVCNWTLSDWDNMVSRALVDFPTIHEWELWNEPYSPTQHSGYLTNASRYFQMVKSAYTIIKANDKNDTVVCLGGSTVADTAAMTFTKAFWAYGASSYCDAISLHAYISGNALFNTSAYEAREWPKNLQTFESVTQKPIWITEFGRETSEANSKVHYSQLNQNEFINQSMGIFTSLSFVKRAYVFNLAGLSNPPSNTDFGLLNATTLKPKIAWFNFLGMYGKSDSHTKVALVTEKAPTLSIAHLTIPKLLQDKISATAPNKVDPIEIMVNGAVKAKSTGSVTFSFVGGILKKFDITAEDMFTGLETTKTVTVT